MSLKYKPASEKKVFVRCVRFALDGTTARCLAQVLPLLVHPRLDARQSQNPIPRIYRGIDVKSQFLLPLT